MNTKICASCKEEKPISCFGRHKSRPDGLYPYCLECRKVHYHLDHEKELARAKKYREENREKHLDSVRRCRQKNHDKYLARESEYRKEHIEHSREMCRRYYAAHKELFRNKQIRFIENNPNYHKLHRQKNIEVYRETVNRRRARLKNVTVERISREFVYKRDNGRCHICGKKVSQKNWHIDHLIPVSLGGPHILSNVAVACPSCNIKRGNRGPAQLRLFGEL